MTDILTNARDLIFGERAEQYGDAKKNFAVVATYWRTYMLSRGIITTSEPAYLTARDVVMMMALLKVARLGNDPDSKDSLVDAAGYIGLVGKIGE